MFLTCFFKYRKIIHIDKRGRVRGSWKEEDAFDERAMHMLNLIPRNEILISCEQSCTTPLRNAPESRLSYLYYNGRDDSSIVRNVR